MIKLPDGELRDYLPVVMKNDVDMVCFSYALKKAAGRLVEYQKSAMTYNIIDNLPEQVLDILAVEMRSVYYLDSLEIETKRKIIKNTLRWYAKAGTLGATKELASVMFGAGGISEWFEYGGRPFCFRPVIGIEASQEEVNIFLKYLKLVKNTRSWLDAIIYAMIIDHRNLESIILQNILFKMQIPFWGVHLLNGARLLDGSVLLNARRRYDLVLGIKNDIKFHAKEAVNTDRIYINIPSCFNTYEKICGAKVLFRLGGFSFWKCAVLNGIRLLDGSVLLNSRKKYDLVLGINNAIKLSINEDIDVDKVYMKITSCFNINESINSLRAVFKLGCSGLWEFINNMPGKYNMPLKVTMPACAGVKQDMDAVSLANGIIKVQAEEKTGAALACKASVNFLQGTSKENALTAGTRHMASAGVSETVGEVTITYRRDLCYLDGSGLLDGSRLVNAFYGKESI